MAAKRDVHALLFDVFGTVVDWRASIIADLTRSAPGKACKADWAAFTDDWRGLYQPAMEEVRSGPPRLDHPGCAAPRKPRHAARQVQRSPA